MFRKLITGILILTLLGQVGCYTSTQITLEEWIDSDESGDLLLTANDTLNYKFEENNYIIKSDTLCGKGIEYKKNKWRRNFEGCIPKNKIHSVEASRFNTVLTVLSIAVVIGSLIAIGLNYKPLSPSLL